MSERHGGVSFDKRIRSYTPDEPEGFKVIHASKSPVSGRAPEPEAMADFKYSTLLRKDSNATESADSIFYQGKLENVVHAGGHLYGQGGSRITPSARFSSLSVEESIQLLGANVESGLSSADVSRLRLEHGFNELPVPATPSTLLKFLKSLWENPLILLLLASASVSVLVGNFDDAASITIAVMIVVAVGFIQEQRSEKSLEALNKLVPHYCHLIRDGIKLHPLCNTLVPGDLITLSTGDRVPADVRIIESVDVTIDESSLTGESKAIRKNSSVCSPSSHGDIAISARSNIAHMGTLLKHGRCKAVVVGTGQSTEFGAVFSLMQEVEEKRTPLQLTMDDLAKTLSTISFCVIGVIVLIGVIQSRSWLEMFTIGVSLAVAAIPEGLPIVTSVTLALGVMRMSSRKAIVKKLHSVETLGSISVICSDKTGTLTENKMTVTHIYCWDSIIKVTSKESVQTGMASVSEALSLNLLIGNLCNNATKTSKGWSGQSTDIAFMEVLDQFSSRDVRQDFLKQDEVPFSSETKQMSVSGQYKGGIMRTYCKGALETILPNCNSVFMTESQRQPLDIKAREKIMSRAAELADKGLRVLALGFCDGSVSKVDKKASYVFVGLQAMEDPPRQGVSVAICRLQAAGIHVAMITGDSERTALSIARQLGLRVNYSSTTSCLTGSEIDKLSEKQLCNRVKAVCVFARTTPRHKLDIVRAYQTQGEIVAMTGDGVNDAPATKAADIGISMGSGTDVAKEAADVILVDDNFATILPAVEEGKSIFYNIQNFLSFQLSTATAALFLITISTALHLENPLNAMQILFINIIMDGPPSQSLGVDPVNRDVMLRPPRLRNAPVLTRRLLARIAFSAALIIIGVLFVYVHEIGHGHTGSRDQTMTFTAFVVLDLISALQNRGVHCTIKSNRILLSTISVSLLVQFSLIYFPLFQPIFQTEALGFHDIFVITILGGLSMALHEMRRIYERNLDKLLDLKIQHENDHV